MSDHLPAAVPDSLPDLAVAEERLLALAETDDAAKLHDVAATADAHRLYEARAENLERANAFLRLRLLAEAALGHWSLADRPTLNSAESVVDVAGKPVPVSTVARWRVLAIAQERKLLEGVLRDIEAAGEATTSRRTAVMAQAAGATLVARRDLERRVKAAAGVSVTTVCERLGIVRPTSEGVTWRKAKQICAAVGLDPVELAPFAPRRRGHGKGTKSRGWVTRERKRTGGRWDECYSRLRLLIDEFARLAPNHDAAFDEPYEHLHELEEFIGRRLQERRAA